MRKDLERRIARGAVEHAIFRWESAVVIAATIALAVFEVPPFKWWMWLIGGIIAEGILIYVSFADIKAGRYGLSMLFREEFNPRAIHSQKYREKMERSLEYRDHIEKAIQKTGEQGDVLYDHLLDTARRIGDWLANIFKLAQYLDNYERDELIQQDLRAIPIAIQNIRQQVFAEDSDAVREQMLQAINAKENQLKQLEALENKMQRAEYQLETTLTSLGTMYSQILHLSAKDINSGRAKRMLADIDAEVNSLNDIIDTMNEIQTL